VYPYHSLDQRVYFTSRSAHRLRVDQITTRPVSKSAFSSCIYKVPITRPLTFSPYIRLIKHSPIPYHPLTHTQHAYSQYHHLGRARKGAGHVIGYHLSSLHSCSFRVRSESTIHHEIPIPVCQVLEQVWETSRQLGRILICARDGNGQTPWLKIKASVLVRGRRRVPFREREVNADQVDSELVNDWNMRRVVWLEDV
jgi:hypothetical protein